MLLYSIGFCHKSKEQRLKITKNADNNSLVKTNLVTFFKRVSFLVNEFVKKLYKC